MDGERKGSDGGRGREEKEEGGRGKERKREGEEEGDRERDRKSTRLNSSHVCTSRMPSSA